MARNFTAALVTVNVDIKHECQTSNRLSGKLLEWYFWLAKTGCGFGFFFTWNIQVHQNLIFLLRIRWLQVFSPFQNVFLCRKKIWKLKSGLKQFKNAFLKSLRQNQLEIILLFCNINYYYQHAKFQNYDNPNWSWAWILLLLLKL